MELNINFTWKIWADELPTFGEYFFVIGHTDGFNEYGLQSLACQPVMYMRKHKIIYDLDENHSHIRNEKNQVVYHIDDNKWYIENTGDCTSEDGFGSLEPKYWIYVEDLMPMNYRISYEDYFKLIKKSYESSHGPITDDTIHKICEINY